MYYCVQLYVGPRDSNSGLLKCTASTLSIELSPRRVNLTTMGLAVHADADLCVRILSGICCVQCYCLSVCRRRLFQPYHSYKKYWNLSVRFCILDFMGSSSNLPILQDLEKESDTPLQQVSIEEILEEQRVEQQTRLEAEKLKVQALKDRGLSIPRADTLDEY